MLLTTRRKKHLRDNINKLSSTEHDEIFKMLRECDLNFTTNKNGTFFDMANINEITFEKIEQFVEFCLCNKKNLDDYDQKIKECKINNNFDKLQVSSPLNNVINSEKENTDDWMSLLNQVKSSDKVSAFVNLLENGEKLVIKKTNSKFMNIKKKFSKKIVSEKKNDSELLNILFKEAYDS